jgi:hypothetical protein
MPARCSSFVLYDVISAAAQLVDHLPMTVERVDVYVGELAGCVVELDAAPATESARYFHGPDG